MRVLPKIKLLNSHGYRPPKKKKCNSAAVIWHDAKRRQPIKFLSNPKLWVFWFFVALETQTVWVDDRSTFKCSPWRRQTKELVKAGDELVFLAVLTTRLRWVLRLTSINETSSCCYIGHAASFSPTSVTGKVNNHELWTPGVLNIGINIAQAPWFMVRCLDTWSQKYKRIHHFRTTDNARNIATHWWVRYPDWISDCLDLISIGLLQLEQKQANSLRAMSPSLNQTSVCPKSW